MLSDPSPDQLRSVAHALFLDARAAQAFTHLQNAAIPALLLKGPSIARWLYRDGTPRPYNDIDLLVSPADWERAAEALHDIDFHTVRELGGGHWSEMLDNEQALVDPQGVVVDLHRRLLGVPPEQADRAWSLLHGGSETMTVGGREVAVLSEPARVMHLALHAAQNGPAGRKSLTDLERGLSLLSPDCWLQASRLAEAMGAGSAFAAGLRLSAMGQELAEDLQLGNEMRLEQALRVISAPEHAQSFARRLELTGPRAVLAASLRELWPSRAAVVAWHPQVGQSRVRYLLWRLRRPLWVLSRLPTAILWVFRARRATAAQRPTRR